MMSFVASKKPFADKGRCLMSPESAGAAAEPRDPASPPHRPPRRIKLLWTLLGVMLLTALVPLFLTAWKLIDINKESLEAASREYQLEVASAIVQELNAVTAGANNQLAATVTYLSGKMGSHPDPLRAGGDDLLAPYLAGDLISLRYTSREGSILEVGDRERFHEEAVSSSLFEAFATAMQGEPYVGRPASGRGSNGLAAPSVVVALPVRVGGEVRGVLAGIVDLSAPWARSVASLGANYIIFGLDDSGSLFASSVRLASSSLARFRFSFAEATLPCSLAMAASFSFLSFSAVVLASRSRPSLP